MHDWKKRIAVTLALMLCLAACAAAEGGFQSAGGGVFQFSAPAAGSSPFLQGEQAPQAAPQQSAPQQSAAGGPDIPTATLSPKVAELPWNLMLVNSKNPVPDDWEIELATLDNGCQVDKRILPDLQRMFNDCRAAGLLPMVKTAYRSYEDQKEMLVLKYRQYRNAGMGHEEAQAAALKVANYPGYSEHQLGLAVDIDSSNVDACSNESVWYWVKHHCHEYGFIWRYPAQRAEITGISNEDWHFRYVGVEAATYMMTNYLCLEEYLQQFYDIPY